MHRTCLPALLLILAAPAWAGSADLGDFADLPDARPPVRATLPAPIAPPRAYPLSGSLKCDDLNVARQSLADCLAYGSDCGIESDTYEAAEADADGDCY